MKIRFSFLLFFISLATLAQEFNATVTVNAEQTGKTKLSIFKTLEGAVQDFINQNNWTTNNDLESYEKIDCNFFINVSQYSSDNFTATIQVQASRPVYGSTTSTPIFNFKDNQFNFRYTEFQPLDYNPNTYSSNLVSTISFYLYTILGIDGDTFAPMGGENYHQEAKLIVNTAQGRAEGWQPNDGNQSRFRLNADFLSNNFSKYREALYTYHREGLDVMYTDVEAGKQKIVEAIQTLREVNNSRPNSILIRSFFDAKNDEITRIFSGGPQVALNDVLDNLKRIAPLYNKKWNAIRN